jgi:hypothetical protein
LKTIHLNLAARPFRDYRPLYAVVVAASLLIAFLMLNNIDTYYRYTRETRTTRQEIASLESQIQAEHEKSQAAAGVIKTMDLETLGDQTRFVNAKLAERAFSWSELLERLEVVLPRDVRLTSIAPSFGDDGMVTLGVVAEAKTPDGMVMTIDRLNGSPHFANAFPGSDTSTETGHRFNLTVDYKPSIPRVAARAGR